MIEVRWKRFLNQFYIICCVIATIVLILNCFYNFWKDKDTSQITFKMYHEEKDGIYPSVSLCFEWPFLKERFENLEGGITASNYSQFLKGEFWDDKYQDIDYDNVTLDLKSYLASVKIENTIGVRKMYSFRNDSSDNSSKALSLSVSSRSSDEKCYSIDIPYKEKEYLKLLEIKFNKTIFHDTKTGIGFKDNFYIAFHYPSQFRTSSVRSSVIRYDVKSIVAESGRKGRLDKVTFTIMNVEVLRRRDKRTENCNWDWKRHDDYFNTYIVQDVGCRLPYLHHANEKLNKCSNSQELSKFDNEFHGKIPGSDSFIKPCLTIEKMFYRYDEMRQSVFLSLSSLLTIEIRYEDSIFKEIEYIQGKKL